MQSTVIAVACQARHRFAKSLQPAITLLAGLGVEGDAHCGPTMRHRSRWAKDKTLPNIRQVHLLHQELFAELAEQGYAVQPGELGENVTTAGIDLLSLGRGTRLRLGPEALVELTGLRNPCRQIDTHIGAGAMAATLARDAQGGLVRKAGVMAIVVHGGEVRPGDAITIDHAPAEHQPLLPV